MFQKIDVSMFQDYMTKYPNGRTIFESLSTTLSSFNSYVDEINAKFGTLPEQMKALFDSSVLTVDQLQVLKEYYAAQALLLEANYAPRLTSVESQLAEKVQQDKDIAINVKSLGAVLDGIVDCTQYLIDAHDMLPTQGGKIIIPVGKMLITSLVNFTKTIILEGVSRGNLFNTSGSVILTSLSGELVFRGAGSGIRDVMVDGLADNTQNGVTMICSRPFAENLVAVNQGKHGLQIGSETEFINVNSWFISNLIAKNNKGDGLFIGHPDAVSPDANAGTLIGIDSGSNLGNGMTSLNCFDNQFIGVHFENNSGYGVKLINSDSNAFFKPYLEANALGDFKADENSIYNYVFGHRKTQSIGNIIFDNVDNFIMGRSAGKGLFPLSNKQSFVNLSVSNEAITGFWDINQDGASRDMVVTLNGTSADASILFKSGSTGKVTHKIDQLQLGAGTVLKKHLSVSGTLNFGTSISANSTKETTVTVAGASVGDAVYTTVGNGSLEAGLVWSAYVSIDNTVVVRLANVTTTSIPLTSRGWRTDVWKH